MGSVEPEICINRSEIELKNSRKKFPVTTHGYSMVKFAHLDETFLEFFKLEASPAEGESLPQKDKKMRKRRGTKKWKKTKSLKT